MYGMQWTTHLRLLVNGMTVPSAQCVKTDCRHILPLLLYFNGLHQLQTNHPRYFIVLRHYIHTRRAVDCYIFYILPFVRVNNTLRSCQSFCAGGNVTLTGSSPNISKFLQRFWRERDTFALFAELCWSCHAILV